MAPEFEHQLPNGERLIVVDSDTAAEYLARVLQSFEDGNSEPLIVANDDKPQGVVIPFEQWLDYLDLAEEAAGEERIANIVRDRIRSSRPDEGVDLDDFLKEIDDSPSGRGDG
ncbi:hypothetical protein [Microlunatus soli]|uniref:Antitoxin n=1 Tax=Microlunatus soli TaxID=630515 RepID=A0A1H1TV42_9ACTN|nr:hypothetical protein [Microlunatus soli]SDS64062.1 hypothetical protein SAMN04489812_2533 [Microlunatus soli]